MIQFLKDKFLILLLLGLNLSAIPSQALKNSILDDEKTLNEVVVVFGYNDQHPGLEVLDFSERQRLLEKLTSPCSNTEAVCGFNLDFNSSSEYADILYKKSRTSEKIIRISILNSSVSAFDPFNRKTKDQGIKSSAIRLSYLQSLAKAKSVFYVGHARYGWGPDFSPAQLDQKGQVDKSYYMKKSENFNQTLQAIQNSQHLKFFAILACDSDLHFGFKLKQVAKPVHYLLTKSAAQSEILNTGLIVGLEYALGNLSKTALVTRLNSGPFVIR